MSLISSTAFFFFFISLSTFPSTPKSAESIMVQVKYSRQPRIGTEGQPLTLKCTAEYENKLCGNILVFWCLSVSGEQCQPLTDPDRYLIQINESKLEDFNRHRDAFVTFTQLTLNDTGLYQCKAVCNGTGPAAMGHLINVTVTGWNKMTDVLQGNTNKGQGILNLRDRCGMDMFLLTISVFMLLWIQ